MVWRNFEVIRLNSGATKFGKYFVRFYIWFGRKGNSRSSDVPDLLVFGHGLAFFIETKRVGEEQNEGQKEFRDASQGSINTYDCRSVADAERAVKREAALRGVQRLAGDDDGWLRPQQGAEELLRDGQEG